MDSPLLILMVSFIVLACLKTYIARTNRLSGQNVFDKTDNILSKGAAIASLPKANDETILTKTVIISKLEDADKQLMPVLCPKGKSCDFSLLNTEPADENLAWFAPAYDLALSVPFNNRWGTIGFGIAPVWESSLRGIGKWKKTLQPILLVLERTCWTGYLEAVLSLYSSGRDCGRY